MPNGCQRGDNGTTPAPDLREPSLITTAWPNMAILEGDLIDAVKGERRDVIITGSLSVVHALMGIDLIDEYRLLTFPTVLGAGDRPFPGCLGPPDVEAP